MKFTTAVCIAIGGVCLAAGAIYYANKARKHEILGYALVVAIKRDDVDTVRRLLARGADPRYRYRTLTPRGVALALEENTFPLPPKEAQNDTVWQRLRSKLAGNTITNRLTSNAEVEPLILAVDGTIDMPNDGDIGPRSPEIVKALLESGADPNVANSDKRSALWLAQKRRNSTAAAILISAGAR